MKVLSVSFYFLGVAAVMISVEFSNLNMMISILLGGIAFSSGTMMRYIYQLGKMNGKAKQLFVSLAGLSIGMVSLSLSSGSVLAFMLSVYFILGGLMSNVLYP